MNSKQTLAKIQNQLKELEHKDYCKRSFRSGYLIGYFENKQKKKHYIYELITNVILGLVMSFIIQLILYPLLNIEVSINQNIIITFVFFIASFIRGYVIRRLFNKI
jgi:uncharacterized membrane protein YfhO